LPGSDGAVVENLDFYLKKLEPDSEELDTIPEPVIVTDNTRLIIHEIVQELLTISHDSYAIQIGAFGNKSNAENLRRKLQGVLAKYETEIVLENEMNKLRILEIMTRDEVDNILETLRQNGITEAWVISLKAKQQMVVLVEKRDSVISILESKVFMPFTKSFYKLEAGNGTIGDRPAVKFLKEHSPVQNLEVRDIRPVIRYITDEKNEDASPVRVNVIIEKLKPSDIMNLGILPDPLAIKDLGITKVKVPEISIQVGLFYKKSEALKAQRKIKSKLKVPVVVMEQWEYYIVLIPGFHSREETFMYYPELAGIGYPGVTIIEK
jgi:hypothetical protein